MGAVRTARCLATIALSVSQFACVCVVVHFTFSNGKLRCVTAGDRKPRAEAGTAAIIGKTFAVIFCRELPSGLCSRRVVSCGSMTVSVGLGSVGTVQSSISHALYCQVGEFTRPKRAALPNVSTR
eukprot:2534729-Rhodomonas_salina.1